MVYETYEAAAEAKADDEMICGTRLLDETPRYFIMPADAPDDDVEERSFTIRHGRPKSSYERFIASFVHRPVPA
jgi:hypothetical protein